MPIAPTARVHPTALISPEATLDDGVVVGPYTVIEGEVHVGPGCVIHGSAYLYGILKMGERNQVFPGTVLGGPPQHSQYAAEPTRVEIGDDNIFRENVTIHRGTKHSFVTKVGNNNFLMAGSHIAHDCVVGNHCILANGALVGGHCVVENNVFLSGNSAIHQWVRVGRLALLSGTSASTKDVPPFVIQQDFNKVAAINVVGMRRAGIPPASINAVRQMFHIVFRQGLTIPVSLARAESELGGCPEVMEFVTFVRGASRGITLDLRRSDAA